MRRIPQLDGLRALAVGLVVLDHCVSWFPGGGIGVCIFFVLSGFLITSLLADETTRNGKIGRARFYTRRALRLIRRSWPCCSSRRCSSTSTSRRC